MANNPKPQPDENGNISGWPLLAQSTWALPNDQILLALEVAQNQQQLEAMKGETIHS